MSETIPIDPQGCEKYSTSKWRKVSVLLAAAVLPLCSCSVQEQNDVKVQTPASNIDNSADTPANYPSSFQPTFADEIAPVLNCANTEPWDRNELANFLIDQRALNLSYTGDPSIAAADLRDPMKTSIKLISVLEKVTRYGFCNEVPFDVLILNSGHPTHTTNGSTSQHVVGDAVDIRPRRLEQGYDIPYQTSSYRTVTEIIVDDKDQTERAKKLIAFILSDEILPDIHQMIITGLDPNWDRGEFKQYSSWPDSVQDYHYDHIHIGVVPGS